MVDPGTQRELLPHYVVLLVVLLIALAGIRAVLGDVNPLANIAVVVVIVLVYPTIVELLGVAPEAWRE
jgi:hypothetical protein